MRHADDWSWVTARRQRKKRKVLAGFARATGDGALTATIHDLVVLPELQGLGLGRKLLAKATIQASVLAPCTTSVVATGAHVSTGSVSAMHSPARYFSIQNSVGDISPPVLMRQMLYARCCSMYNVARELIDCKSAIFATSKLGAAALGGSCYER
jgi:hypothetical protein